MLMWLVAERIPAQLARTSKVSRRITLTPVRVSVQHDHCDCVESLQCTVESLQREVDYLQSERMAKQVKETELLHQLEEEKARRDFCIDRQR